TGSVTNNRELSRRRALRVQQILRDFAPNAQLQVFAHGEYYAATPDKVESPQERRVRITVTHHAPGAPTINSPFHLLSRLPDLARNAIEAAMRLGDGSLALQIALKQGIRDVNQLTNLLFFARRPERKGRLLVRGERDFAKLSEEWRNIRD